LIEVVRDSATTIDGGELVNIIKRKADENRVEAFDQKMEGRRMYQ
jgi:hypothetical protein